MRINNDNIRNGYAISESVSPFDSRFPDAIEDGIRDIVFALVTKNYLTLSSCEGHTKYDTTNVVLAFQNRLQIIRFIKELSKHNIPKLEFRQLDLVKYMEPVEEWKPEYAMIPEHRRQGEYNTRRKMKQEEAIECLNHLYRRNYTNYHLLEMIIVPNVEMCNSWWEEVKLRWWKIFNKKKTLKKLLAIIKGMSYYDM